MVAIIFSPGGTYYTSLVFGVYWPVSDSADTAHSPDAYEEYFLVLDQEKTRLVRQRRFSSQKSILKPAVLITDTDRTNWKLDENGRGCVDFLAGLPADRVADDISPALLERCIAMDAAYHCEPWREIRTEKDIHDLLCVAGGFHDAYVDRCEPRQDGSLYVFFKGEWGCSIEILFSGEVSWSIKSRDDDSKWWFDSSVLLQDGFVYFVDEEGMTVDRISDEYCWFKARHMKYHILPEA